MGVGAGFNSVSLRPVGMDGSTIKVNRKRVHRIGSAKVSPLSISPTSAPTSPNIQGPMSSVAPSEMSDYFPQAAMGGGRRGRGGGGGRSSRY